MVTVPTRARWCVIWMTPACPPVGMAVVARIDQGSVITMKPLLLRKHIATCTKLFLPSQQVTINYWKIFIDSSLILTQSAFVFLELNDHIENMIGLICKTHGLPEPLSLAAVSLVSRNILFWNCLVKDKIISYNLTNACTTCLYWLDRLGFFC